MKQPNSKNQRARIKQKRHTVRVLKKSGHALQSRIVAKKLVGTAAGNQSQTGVGSETVTSETIMFLSTTYL